MLVRLAPQPDVLASQGTGWQLIVAMSISDTLGDLRKKINSLQMAIEMQDVTIPEQASLARALQVQRDAMVAQQKMAEANADAQIKETNAVSPPPTDSNSDSLAAQMPNTGIGEPLDATSESRARQARKLASALRESDAPDAVPVNTGTNEELKQALCRLPGFRVALANRIVELRPFRNKQELLDRVNDGIAITQQRLGPKWLRRLRIEGQGSEGSQRSRPPGHLLISLLHLCLMYRRRG